MCSWWGGEWLGGCCRYPPLPRRPPLTFMTRVRGRPLTPHDLKTPKKPHLPRYFPRMASGSPLGGRQESVSAPLGEERLNLWVIIRRTSLAHFSQIPIKMQH